MRRDCVHAVMLVMAAIGIGIIAWNGNVLLLPAACLFPALWSMSRSRLTAGLVSAAYFLSASRGLPQGIAVYYGSDIWPGLFLWLAASSAFTFVHSVAWTRQDGWRRASRYLIAIVLMAVPPFGILGWAQPITAAGVVFPGWSWFGLSMMAASLAVMTTKLRPAAAFALAGFWLWSAAEWTAPALPASWYGVDQKRGAELGRDTTLEGDRVLAATVLDGRGVGDRVAVLPESALGFWTPTTERFWTRQLASSGLTVVAGAAILDPAGYDNVLVSVSEHGGTIVYRERMPVPGAMWQPWQSMFGGNGSAKAHFFANPIARIEDARAAELMSMLPQAEILQRYSEAYTILLMVLGAITILTAAVVMLSLRSHSGGEEKQERASPTDLGCESAASS